MAIIANLSSIFKLKPIHPTVASVFGTQAAPDMISIFAQMRSLYAKNHCYCSKSLFGMTNYAMVCAQFLKERSLIDNYKLGKITTDQFLAALLKNFSFLKTNEEVKNPNEVLINTWNKIIEWDDQSDANLWQLLEHAERGEPVYLIANTNLLNVMRILELFRTKFPSRDWDFSEALKEGIKPEPIQIAPNVFLCTSYRYGLFKEGTPGLVAKVAKQIQAQEKILVSQYPQDLEIGRTLNLQVTPAQEFYTEERQEKLLPHFT